MDTGLSKEAVARADTALQKALVTNFEPLEKVEVWFVGGAVLGSATNALDNITLMARLYFTDGGLEKLDYTLKEEDMKWMTGARKMFEWATGYLAAHLSRAIYRIEYTKADD